MKFRKTVTLILVISVTVLGCKNEAMITPVCNPRLIVMEGQSNNVGVAPGNTLQSDLTGVIPGAKIFYGNSLGTNFNAYTWQNLQYNITNDGTQGLTSQFRGYFGTELRIMKLLNAYYGGQFYLMKIGQGGTSLGQWSGGQDWSPASTGEYYTMSNAYELAGVAKLTDHRPPALYVWIQGEQDSFLEYSSHYAADLTQYIGLKRALFNSPNMPFIICGLSNQQTSLDPTNRNAIRAAQQYVCAHVANCTFVSFDDMPTNTDDHLHYTAAGYDTGAHRIFKAMKDLLPIIVARILLPTANTTFANAGFTAANTDEIFKIEANRYLSWKPNRAINAIDSLNTNSNYYAKMAGTAKPGNYCYEPNN